MSLPLRGLISGLCAAVALHAGAAAAITISYAGTYTTGDPGASAEISAYDAATRRLFVTNSLDRTLEVIDLTNPAAPVKINTIPLGGDPTHVSVKNGVVAVGVVAAVTTDPGTVQLYDAADWGFGAPATPAIATLTVGALPDMVTFTPDGTRILVANEGEATLTANPEGSVSIIDISGGAGSASVIATAGFSAYNGQEAALRAADVRIIPDPAGPAGVTVAQDFEPEFISVSPDGTQAFVTIQEANAVAVLDLTTNTITEIQPLGLKDHSLPGNGLDTSDRDNGSGGPSILIRNQPVLGMYQPDGIASYEVAGQTFYVTANEGDSRAFEEIRVGAAGYVLDPTAFPNAAALKNNAVLGRLQLTNATGDTNGDGDKDEIHAFGARSFSIWDAAGNQVYDSGDDFEQITASLAPAIFNSDGTVATFDTRSDNKGPEPEGVTVATIFGRTYAFVGLERVGGFMVYDVTDPSLATYVEFVRGPLTDLAPEGMLFIAASESPTGNALLVVSNEVSGTASIYSIVPEPGTALLLASGLAGLLGARRRA